MTDRRRSWWGWGWEDEALGDTEAAALGSMMAGALGVAPVALRAAPTLDDVALPPPRVPIPEAFADWCATDPYERALHTYGRAYRDVVRAVAGRFEHPPDVVARPRDERDVVAVLDWASDAGVAVIPFGGGSSVVGGVEARVGDGFAGVVSLDLTALDAVLEVDRTSRAARIQAGALGPRLEDQLRPHDLTLRHFPQSFEFSTLGGWLATRAGGHYATVMTHIDDLVESIRAVTPSGVWESRRLPGSGAGPSPDRLLLGSEGILGVITEAWMRVQDRPRWKASAGVHFSDYDAAVAAVRAISQAGLYPTNCRLLDSGEALLSAGVSDGSHLLVLGFESADHQVDPWLARALELVADHGGVAPGGVSSGRDGSVGAWRSTFLRAPYLRDALVRCGMIVETFETACTWDRFPALHAGVVESLGRAIEEVCGRPGIITCRFTHVYPDGPAPYFSVYAPGRAGSELAMWDELKAVAAEAVIAGGGTITHHHAVGRDHRPGYDRQRPELFATALVAAKATLDPAGVLNPGVLVDGAARPR